MEKFIPEIENEAYTSTHEMFSTDTSPEVVFDDEKSDFLCQKVLKIKPNSVNQFLKICLNSQK